jgi:NAD(P) transhydrogenase subunit alpha
MIIGIPKESYPGERRAAITPAVVPSLTQMGLKILIEAKTGEGAGYSDLDFNDRGAKIAASRQEVFSSADVIIQVLALSANPPAGLADLKLMHSGQTLIGFLRPLARNENLNKLAQTGVTAFALELLPRITRAQPMDALSSMSTLAGYKAVLEAAAALPKMFPMIMSAAGTLKPARVLVLGAGVLGLQAIATARRLGGVVQAYDIRPAVKQEVESLGAKFVELPLDTDESTKPGGYAKAKDDIFYRRQREVLGSVVAESDVVICAAVVPGSHAPVLVTENMVKTMAFGSVVVDLAGEWGGNCEIAEPDCTFVKHGVTIMSPININSTIAVHASQMYAKNISALLHYLIKDGKVSLDLEDDIIAGMLVTHDGKIVHPRVRGLLNLAPLNAAGKGS